MNVAIVDDEAYYRDLEKGLLKQLTKISVTAYSSTKALLQSGRSFDLLILDIEMPNENGIEFAKTHVKEYPHIIYVTSHEELVYEAFHVNVLGYILKKNLEVEFAKKVETALQYAKSEIKLTFRTKNGFLDIYEKDIFYACIDYDSFYIITEQSNLVYLTSLKELRDQLSEDFFMINRNEIVNVKNVEHIFKATHTIKMKNGSLLKVSERRWKAFKEAFMKGMNIC